MIDDKTIKSLYDDKPTLLEWLKRVEAQLEELKKITNFDTLTANSVEVKEDVGIGGFLNGNEANFENSVSFQNGVSVNGDFNVNGKSVCRNIYVHKISWKYTTLTSPNVYLCYLSTKPTPYSSMADIFSHKNETDLTTSEVIEYMDLSAIVKFSPTGDILNVIGISANNGKVSTFAMGSEMFEFVKDEVIGGWGV